MSTETLRGDELRAATASIGGRTIVYGAASPDAAHVTVAADGDPASTMRAPTHLVGSVRVFAVATDFPFNGTIVLRSLDASGDRLELTTV